MANYTLVQSAFNTSNGGSGTVIATFGSGTTAGNLIIAIAGSVSTGTTFTSITDNLSGGSSTYNNIDTQAGTAIGKLASYYVPNCGSGITQVTFTHSGVAPAALIILEYSGLATSSPLDQHVITENTGGTNPTSGNTSTTTKANELVFGYVLAAAASQTVGAGSGFGNLVTAATSSFTICTEDMSQTSVAAQSASFTDTSSIEYQCGVATFISTIQPVLWTSNNLLLLGVG